MMIIYRRNVACIHAASIVMIIIKMGGWIGREHGIGVQAFVIPTTQPGTIAATTTKTTKTTLSLLPTQGSQLVEAFDAMYKHNNNDKNVDDIADVDDLVNDEEDRDSDQEEQSQFLNSKGRSHRFKKSAAAATATPHGLAAARALVKRVFTAPSTLLHPHAEEADRHTNSNFNALSFGKSNWLGKYYNSGYDTEQDEDDDVVLYPIVGFCLTTVHEGHPGKTSSGHVRALPTTSHPVCQILNCQDQRVYGYWHPKQRAIVDARVASHQQSRFSP